MTVQILKALGKLIMQTMNGILVANQCNHKVRWIE